MSTFFTFIIEVIRQKKRQICLILSIKKRDIICYDIPFVILEFKYATIF